MSRKCELTGKSPLKGHKVSHANNKTKRKFLPNLKKVTFVSNILKKNIKLKNPHVPSTPLGLTNIIYKAITTAPTNNDPKNLVMIDPVTSMPY